MGDNAAGTAKLLLLMLPLRATSANIDPPVITDGDKKPLSDQTITEDTIVSELLALGQEPCQMLRGAIHAFEQKDAHAAYKICQEGELVNERYRLVHNDLTTILTGKQAIFALQQDPAHCAAHDLLFLDRP